MDTRKISNTNKAGCAFNAHCSFGNLLNSPVKDRSEMHLLRAYLNRVAASYLNHCLFIRLRC